MCADHAQQALQCSPSVDLRAPGANRLHIHLEELPTTLAVVVNDFLKENNPFIKLHRLTDAAEILTRFVAVILLNDILRIHEEFPDSLRRFLAERIERPTFGAWRNLLDKAHEFIQKNGKECFVPELSSFIEQILLPSLGWGEGDVHQSIIALRNLLHHQGRFNDSQAQALLQQHEVEFERLLSSLAFWSRYDLVAATTENRVASLKGILSHEDSTNESEFHSPEADELVPTHVFLTRNGLSLDLFPLQIFDEVWQWCEEKPLRISGPALQLFFRLSGKGYLEFTPLSHSFAFAQHRGAVLEKFKQTFPVSEWRTLDELDGLSQDAMFAELVAELSEVFVGREKHIAHVKDCLKQHNRGVLWIPGKPGVGKSALMARLMRDFKDAVQHYVVIPYFFRIGHTGCSTEQFLKTAILKLQTALKVPLGVSPNLEERKEQFVSVVEEAARRLNRKILFLIDGMDEINRLEPTFISLPFAANVRNVVWLCAGRTEPPEIEAALKRGGAYWVFLDGLPEMGTLTIRSMLTTHLEQMKYQLFARDQLSEGEYHNQFIDVLVHKSEGLPLYVRMVIEDLREGKWTLADEERLPDGLRAYFEQVLERLGVSSIGSVLTPLFCLLAWAKEPITESALKLLLSSHYLSHEPEWERHFNDALQHGHVMLRRVPTPDGAAGWMFYHDTFRQHLLESARVRMDRSWAQSIWLQHGQQWRSVQDESLRLYLLRNYAEHLAEAKRWEDLFDLARDAEVHRAQSEACPSEPELPLRLIRTALTGAAEIDNAFASAEFMFAHARKLSEIIQEMPIDALRNGQLERAWEIADLHATERSALWYLILAAELKNTGRVGDARATLERLEKNQLTRLSHEYVDPALGLLTHLHAVNESCFLSIQRQLLDEHDRHRLVEHLLPEGTNGVVTQVAETIESEWERFGALEKIAKAQAKAGEYSAAYETAERIGDERTKSELQAHIESRIHSAVLTKVFDKEFDTAFELAKLKRSPAGQLIALRHVAIAQANSGMFAGAVATASNVTPLTERDDLLVLIATEQARQGDVTAALGFSQVISTESKKSDLKYQVTLQQIKLEDLTGALATAESITDRERRDKGLLSLVRAYSELTNFNAAFEIVVLIKGPEQRAMALNEIALKQVDENQFVNALQTAMQISVEERRWATLRTLAQIQAHRWNISQKLIGGTNHEQYRKSIEIFCTLALTYTKQAATRAVIFAAAMDLVQVFERISQRITALKIIVMAQTSADDLVLAQTSLQQILSSFKALGAQPDVPAALQQVAKLQWQLGDFDGAQVALTKAAELIRKSPNAAEMLRRLALVHVQIDDTTAAIERLAEASELALRITNTARRENILKLISHDQAYVRDFQGATTTAERINNHGRRNEALEAIEKIRTQDPFFALQFLKLDSDLDKQYDAISLGDKTLAAIAKVQAEAENLEAALYSLKRIKNSQERITTLRRIGKVLFKRGEVETLHAIVKEFADSSKLIPDHAQRSHRLLEIAQMQRQFDDSETARSTLRVAAEAARLMSVDDLKKRDRRLRDIAIEQMKHGARADALETMSRIHGEDAKAEIEMENMRTQAMRLAGAMRYDEALTLANQIPEVKKRTSTITEIARIQMQIEKAKADAEAVAPVTEIAHTLITAESPGLSTALNQDAPLLLTAAPEPVSVGDNGSELERQSREVFSVTSPNRLLESAFSHTPQLQPAEIEPVEDAKPVVWDTVPKQGFEIAELLQSLKVRSDSSPKENVREQSLLNITVAQLEVDDLSGAWKTLSAIGDSEMREWAISEIVSHHISKSDFISAFNTACKITNIGQRTNDLIAIAAAQADALKLEDAEQTLGIAAEVAQGSPDPEQRAAALCSVASSQALIGSHSTTNTYAKALEAATNIEDLNAKIATRLSIASSLVQTGLGEEARAIFATTSQTLREISDSDLRDRILLDWGVVQMAMEQFEKARYTICDVRDISLRGEGLSSVAVAQSRAGDFEGAFKTAHLIPQKWRRVQALSAIASSYARAGQLEMAQPIFDEAIALAKNLKDASRQDETLQHIAVAQVHAGDFEAALSTVQIISDLRLKVRGFEDIALSQAQSGYDAQARTTFSMALDCARSINDDRQRSNVLRDLAVALSQAGLSDESVRTAESILVGREKHVTEVAVSLGEMSHRAEFKRLLVSCSYSFDSVHQVCGTLARLYPEQARFISEVILSQEESSAAR